MENLVGAPGFDPGRLQQFAAPVYKTEPHASADAVRAIFLIAQKWSEWLDSNQRPLRSERRALPGCATLQEMARHDEVGHYSIAVALWFGNLRCVLVAETAIICDFALRLMETLLENKRYAGSCVLGCYRHRPQSRLL